MLNRFTQSNTIKGLAHTKFPIITPWPNMCPGPARKQCDCSHKTTKALQTIQAGLDCLHIVYNSTSLVTLNTTICVQAQTIQYPRLIFLITDLPVLCQNKKLDHKSCVEFPDLLHPISVTAAASQHSRKSTCVYLCHGPSALLLHFSLILEVLVSFWILLVLALPNGLGLEDHIARSTYLLSGLCELTVNLRACQSIF